jgi:hypothetical protein
MLMAWQDVVVPLSYERVADQFVAEVPEFDELLEIHLLENNGELLQHVLFWDLTNFRSRRSPPWG